MSYYRHTNYDRSLAAQGLSSSSGLDASPNLSTTGDDELASDVDEPPDNQIQFAKLVTPISQSSASEYGYMPPTHLQQNRKESLLTQALLTSPELAPLSDVEPPVLTSDGGLTSPARTTTPSPPLPTIDHSDLAALISKDHAGENIAQTTEAVRIALSADVDKSQEIKVEEGLGRRRCISFACGRQAATQKKLESPAKAQGAARVAPQPAEPPKRPCMLRFACPMKPSRNEFVNIEKAKMPPDLPKSTSLSEMEIVKPVVGPGHREHRDSGSTIKASPAMEVSIDYISSQSWKAKVFNRVDFQKSEATRFHEFAGSFDAEDEWTNEQTAYRQKMTVNDTLRKENAIRQLGEEAEEEALEEALEEDAEEEVGDDDNEDEIEDDDDNGPGEEEASDEGNETDDEGGFADSDDESDGGSEYQFWTPGLTTAATSADHVDHIRPAAQRPPSESSLESILKTSKNRLARSRKQSRPHKAPRMRPGTPDLPDSTDFVIGTLDEDRPLEEAYMSCLEERRRSRHKVIPQDIDPSFPTSEPEADNDDDDEDNATPVDHEPEWVMGRPETSDEEHSTVVRKSSSFTKSTKSPMPSPKRLHSPPPKRSIIHRSPPPRRLFGQSTHRLRSPPPMHKKLTSPPSSRRPSMNGSLSDRTYGIKMPHLAQRPNLTHTTSLPRTPNPFWSQHRKSRFHGYDTPSAGSSPKPIGPSRMDIHSRGPIDIVQGLETKRQRRKEKFWRQHCRNAGKEKERRCQPGKGAQRMRELGQEMQERCKGYGQRAQLVLSV
ncbi:hypothetical protein MMC28_005432 [Mycoblastus sanguinarius]|nr:hypothetical protein [Mycoblastus sanguinarius]